MFSFYIFKIIDLHKETMVPTKINPREQSTLSRDMNISHTGNTRILIIFKNSHKNNNCNQLISKDFTDCVHFLLYYLLTN